MSDYTLPPRSTLIVGMPGSGKTTFALLALQNEPVACRFIFDDLGQAAARLHRPHSNTAEQLEAALPSRWVLFNPHVMFPGQIEKGFAFFCDWVYECSRRSPGPKVVFVDEVWRFQTPHGIPLEMATCCQAGRSEHIHMMTATQLPHKLHSALIGTATEAVVFRLDEELALEKCREIGIDRTRAQNLPLGAFIARNRLSGREMTGRVF